MNDPFDTYRTQVRERFGRCTPFRLGTVVGAAGNPLQPNPYAPKSKAAELYAHGWDYGRDQRERLARERTETKEPT